MRRGHTKGGLVYAVIYTDLEKAIRELGTVQILEMVNAQLRDRGKQRRLRERKRQQAAAVSEERS